MQSNNTDTATIKTVAAATKEILENGGTVTLSVQKPAFPLRGKAYTGIHSTALYDGVIDTETMNDAEGHAIQALRDWSKAATDPEYMRFIGGLYALRTYVEMMQEGGLDLEAARSIVGNRHGVNFYNCIQMAYYIIHRLGGKWGGDENEDTVSRDSATFADFDAWQVLFTEVTAELEEGGEPERTPHELEGQPEMYAAIDAVKAWIHAKRRDFNAEQKGGTGSAQEGDTAK